MTCLIASMLDARRWCPPRGVRNYGLHTSCGETVPRSLGAPSPTERTGTTGGAQPEYTTQPPQTRGAFSCTTSRRGGSGAPAYLWLLMGRWTPFRHLGPSSTDEIVRHPASLTSCARLKIAGSRSGVAECPYHRLNHTPWPEGRGRQTVLAYITH